MENKYELQTKRLSNYPGVFYGLIIALEFGTPSEIIFHITRMPSGKFGALFHRVTIFSFTYLTNENNFRINLNNNNTHRGLNKVSINRQACAQSVNPRLFLTKKE